MRHISVLGSTGSIGTQTLEVARANGDIRIEALAARGNIALLEEQIREFHPRTVCVYDEAKAAELKIKVADTGTKVYAGQEGLIEVATEAKAKTLVTGIVGMIGIEPTVAAIREGKNIALANKETLVCAGHIIMPLAAREGVKILPVDSEHSAIFQCLRGNKKNRIRKILLTASGGPFRGWTRQQMWDVTPEQAAAHPTWSMGQMNTLNSATLVNKGLELIEASLLFDVPAERIDVTVHPQSIVHSMVTFTDGATIAQASPPSMKLPIALALHWPYRVPGAQPALDFSAATTTNWEFMPVDNEAFPAVQLARQVATYGGMLPAVYNAANEQAAAQFLAGRIAFPQIVDTVSEILSHAEAFARTPESIMEVLECEKEARSLADRYLATIMR